MTDTPPDAHDPDRTSTLDLARTLREALRDLNEQINQRAEQLIERRAHEVAQRVTDAVSEVTGDGTDPETECRRLAALLTLERTGDTATAIAAWEAYGRHWKDRAQKAEAALTARDGEEWTGARESSQCSEITLGPLCNTTAPPIRHHCVRGPHEDDKHRCRCGLAWSPIVEWPADGETPVACGGGGG